MQRLSFSFAQIAYQMYASTSTESVSDSKSLSENNFISASEKELSAIVYAILGNDVRTKQEFDKIKNDNIFERFYMAHKNLVDSSIARIENLLDIHRQNISQTVSQALMATSHIGNSLARLATHHAEIAKDAITNIQASIQTIAESSARIMAAIDFKGLSAFARATTDAMRNSSVFNMSASFTAAMKSVFDRLPKFTFAKTVAPLIEPLQKFSFPLADQLRISLEVFGNALSNIDFSMLTYHKEWSERHDVLLEFGWFYLNELPKELIDDIYERRDELTKEDVNAIITGYFRYERCATIKRIVKKWNKSMYFAQRKAIFHEAAVSHSRRCYNASVTLLTLHTEGVITDFVRLAFNEPRFKAENALSDIETYMNDMSLSTLKLSDWMIFESVITNVQEVLTESFSLANPDAASNGSRHKIAHGHAVEKETEVSSLKCFLYLNELFRMFSVIDDELARALYAEEEASV